MFIKTFVPVLGLLANFAAVASQVGSSAPPRITPPIDETKLIRLSGSTHPLAMPKYDRGAVADSLLMEHMYLQLRRAPAQETALLKYMDQQLNPGSANYHNWLSADELGSKFGPSSQDIDTVVRWLASHGLTVNTVHKSGLTIDVSGTAGQVRETFHTEIHEYDISGQRHIANSTDVQIPAALAPVVVGFVALHDFRPTPHVRRPNPNYTFTCNGCPNGFDGTVQYDVAPGDFATIYNVEPLYKASKPITGKGQTIIVLEESDVNAADIATFRSAFGLSKYSGTFTQIHPGSGCTDPGKPDYTQLQDLEIEAALDAEWAGAVAPDANIQLASCADTPTNAGIFIAAQNLIDSTTPPAILSLSYGYCETFEGPGGNAYLNGLWQQAASEGISVFVSSGDSLSAGCDASNFNAYAADGIAVNGMASTPYDVAVGGTDFLDTADGTNSTYWSNSNGAEGKSALSYVPEKPWNDSCADSVLYGYYGYTNGLDFCNTGNFIDTVGAGGGPSFVYSKPSWQGSSQGPSNVYGIPADGKRDLPDVALFSGNAFWFHALFYCMSDAKAGGSPCNYSNPTDALNSSAGGTSFATPQFAGIQALINQKTASRQGNPNPVLYSLAAKEYGSPTNPNAGELYNCRSTWGNQVCSTCIFYDVITGNNDVPCYGTNDCYDPSANEYGVLSTSDKALQPAFPAARGWDFATGLGSVNVTKLVNSWQ